jgi:tRNA nucleotidyltransferase (CCA-adding enzyme)
MIRVVDAELFQDDPLRVLRGVQFAARFEFDMNLGTHSLCRNMTFAGVLDELPAERVWGEFEKLLFASKPSAGLNLMMSLGIVEPLFPELDALWSIPQDPEWHPEGDVWTHTLLVLDEARKLIDDLPRPKQLAVLLGALCHDFGKPATTYNVDGRIRALGHEEAGVEPTRTFLDRLNVHTVDGYDVRDKCLRSWNTICVL